MDHYQVKWTDRKGKVGYGIVGYEKASRPGWVVVEDAILPITFEVPEKVLVDIKSKIGTYDHKKDRWVNGDEFMTFVEDAFEKARAVSDAIPEGEVRPGSLFKVGVGDGYAHYVVTKVGPRSISYELRNFCPDRWVANVLGHAGSLPRKNIEHLALGEQRRSRHPLFGPKSVTA